MYLCLIFNGNTQPIREKAELILNLYTMAAKFKLNVKTWGADIMAFITIFIVAQLVMGFIAITCLPGVYEGNGTMTDYGFMALYALGMLPILALVTRYESWRYHYSMPIKASARGFDPAFILWGVILLFSANIAITPITSLLPTTSREIPIGGYALFTVCILAPVLEEYIFRGRVFSLLHHSTSALKSAMLTALLFGVVHGSPQVIVEGFVAGLIFSYAYLVKGSIITPIILHMCNNAIGYALIILSYQDRSIAEVLSEHINWPITYAVSLVIALIGMSYVVRTIRRKGRVATKVMTGDFTYSDNSLPSSEPTE